MEGRIRRFLLGAMILAVSFYGGALQAAESPVIVGDEEEQLKPVIQPDIERISFDEARIDTEDFEVTGFTGMLTIEDFGTNPVYGGRFAYHITEDLFIEAVYAQSKGGNTSYEEITGGAPILTDAERKLTYYNASLGLNLFPGETFMTKNLTYNHDLFIIAGVGSSEFGGADRYTINFGAGYRLYLSDFFSVRADFRDHIFNMDLISEEKVTHNPEFTLGVSFFF